MTDPVPANIQSTADFSFTALFGRAPEASADAPGRVNLMGDHTDYNGGYVLPTPLPQRSFVEVASRLDKKVQVWSASVDSDQARKEFSVGQERGTGSWVDYVQAVTASLLAEGRPVTGMDMRISSNVPLGAGLSSSASLLVALFRAISRLVSPPLADQDIARLAHDAETQFVGAPVGIMDQMVCALGRPGSAFFLDVADRQYEQVPLPEAVEWLVIHSGVHHSHATGSYQDRRRECERASALLGVPWLRDLQENDQPELASKIEALPPPLPRRVRHVISENARVLAIKRHLVKGDFRALGAELSASHESLRLDFEVSVPETDLLVELAQADPEVYGARLTGGGFGGSVVIAAQAGTGRRVAREVVEAYRLRSKREGIVLLPSSP
jgi:galactokinase